VNDTCKADKDKYLIWLADICRDENEQITRHPTDHAPLNKNEPMKKIGILCALALTCSVTAQQSVIFPQPNSISATDKAVTCVLSNAVYYSSTPETDAAITIVGPQFKQFHDLELRPQSESHRTQLFFSKRPDLRAEEYSLVIDGKGITITYGSSAGLLYALQSLDQLMEEQRKSVTLYGTTIVDEPAFSWRGVHLDCSRHFFTVAEIKAFLDQMLALKLNTFHWHLTDDQGWRIEIKQYPKLTEVGAWRDSTIVGHYSRTPRVYEQQHYGGFYTQEEAKEIVSYAAKRGITVVPEIELPGHARAALAAYPELGCTGEQLPVPGLWGVFDDVFCSQPETIAFLKNVLEEVVAIFPAETIHVGGDECPKVRWDACPKCKRVMEENGLHDTHELQSYIIREMEAFLRARGKKLMGWDEILEGGLADNAQVMSWRGTEGGIAAAQQHHPVVMTPTAYCYFDYYQSGHPDEPLAIGGFLPLEKVYAFQPVPPQLTEEEKTYVIGGQANLWTEYLPTMDAVEYSAFPRLIAMAQVLWTKERPAYREFVRQMTIHYLPRLKTQGIGYSTAFLDAKLVPVSRPDGIEYRVQPPLNEVRTDPRVITLGQTAKEIPSATITVSSSYNGISMRASGYEFTRHPLLGIPVRLITPPDPKFNNHDSLALTDGVKGKRPWKGDQWLGFSTDTVQFAIDLGSKRTFRELKIGCLHDPGSWIYQPKTILVEISDDGKQYQQWKSKEITAEAVRVTGKGKARFVRITIVNDAAIPAGQPGAGNVPWTFIDELIIQ
jgi:hexosaminidase